ncbi:aspergillopepsin I [Cladophialophora psammophila CBS 110553]|uniref:Aspergillopepsin I n=1 Tax=Cladophialophora psammophila CBS 110553 TaxID=1182543 RepID=W9XCQ9_9EURO|nr:aspergillopepsin I [Cladophialophora psammophila CBS 110553]EXJ75105.1 aspergillopepsin I [Cladophialophora psammophila CBS 110553]
MLQIHHFLLVILFLTATFASPVQKKQKRSFKVPRIQQHNYKPNGKAAYRRALFKFGFGDIEFLPGGEVATRIKAASEAQINNTASENGETTASPTQNDAQFLSPVKIGGQTLIMNFDSGSSDTWVFNTNLPTNSQQGHTIYDPNQSPTFQNTLQGSTFNISYGDGSSASGPVGVDEVDIGGATVSAQAIGLPNTVADSFVTDSASNGLVGLAFSQLNTIQPTQQKTFFDNVLPDLTLPVFTAQLKSGQVGSYEFGNIDTSAFTGQLSTTPVDSSNGFWEVDSTTAAVQGQTVNIANGRAILDTGTSLMLVQNEMLVAYWNTVQGAQLSQSAGGIIFPCNAQLPDLQVAIGANYMATVQGDGMNFANVGTDTQTGQQFCFGGLQSNQGLPFAIYGDVFFRSQFVVFDGSAPSVSIAPHS